MATEDVPAGIDLLRGVRARSRKRVVRIRSLAVVGAAGIVAAAVAVTLSAGPAPTALAQVTRALDQTAATSYQVSATNQIVQAGGLRSPSWSTLSGEFDPAQGVGEQTDNLGDQVRWVAGNTYVFVTDTLRQASNELVGQPIPAWASWEQFPGGLQSGASVGTTGLAKLGLSPYNVELVDPQDLLSVLQSATAVQASGTASGPGWTGSAYSFTASAQLDGPDHTAVSFSGTVDVDAQERVRQFDVLETFMTTVSRVKITFGDFGLPVSVSAPPASQVWPDN
ncbi:MAG: hypothetical protein ACRDRJ_45965 [Streptosporangiaceae bacterium]